MILPHVLQGRLLFPSPFINGSLVTSGLLDLYKRVHICIIIILLEEELKMDYQKP